MPAFIRINPYGIMFSAFAILFLYLFVFGPNMPNMPIMLPYSDAPIDVRLLLANCIHFSQLSGELIKDKVKSNQTLDIRSKGKNMDGTDKLVTKVDIQSHILVVHCLKKMFPYLKVLSEERVENGMVEVLLRERIMNLPEKLLLETESVIVKPMIYKTSAIQIWFDPLDATKEFSEGKLQYVSVMLGIVTSGRLLGGVIHFPFRDETYWSVIAHGHSATVGRLLEERKNSLTSRSKTQTIRVVISMSHKDKAEKYVAEKLGSYTVGYSGGSGYKIIMDVLRGEADIYVHTGIISKWDMCAPHAILFSVGGNCLSLDGEELSYAGPSEEATAFKGRPYHSAQFTRGVVCSLQTHLLKQLIRLPSQRLQ